jgi:hypothetical protein
MNDLELTARRLAIAEKTCKEIEKHYIELIESGLEKDSAKTVLKRAKEIHKQITGTRTAVFNVYVAREIQDKLLKLVSLYLIGERYVFTVMEDKDRNGKRLLKDNYGYEHPVELPAGFIVYDDVTARVDGYRYDKPQGRYASRAFLLLRDICLVEEVRSPKPSRSPEEWSAAVGDMPKHVCGKPFTCDCCGGNFEARKGVRVDGTDVYFCNECKSLVFKPSGSGWRRRFISTPM